MAELLQLWCDLATAVVKAVADGVTKEIKAFYDDRKTITNITKLKRKL